MFLLKKLWVMNIQNNACKATTKWKSYENLELINKLVKNSKTDTTIYQVSVLWFFMWLQCFAISVNLDFFNIRTRKILSIFGEKNFFVVSCIFFRWYDHRNTWKNKFPGFQNVCGWMQTETHLGPYHTSMTELFWKIVNNL